VLKTSNRLVSQTEMKKIDVFEQIDQVSENHCYRDSSCFCDCKAHISVNIDTMILLTNAPMLR